MITQFCYALYRQGATRQRLRITTRRKLQSIDWTADCSQAKATQHRPTGRRICDAVHDGKNCHVRSTCMFPYQLKPRTATCTSMCTSMHACFAHARFLISPNLEVYGKIAWSVLYVENGSRTNTFDGIKIPHTLFASSME